MFFLPFEVKQAPFKVSINDRIVLMGSCFTDNIGDKLTDHKFTTLPNPFGVIYNPLSIFKLLRQSIKREINKENIIESEGIYYHWDMHSTISSNSSQGLIDLIKNRQEVTRDQLSKAGVLILTFGTSFVYHHKEQNNLVSNCHKVPQQSFSKSLLTVDEIKEAYFEMITLLREFNPNLKVIFTVSPVRHVKDGLIENNHSKAILIQAIHEIISNDKDCCYFPSYEMVMDVLRDYRFFKEDMVHPNGQAIQYIWSQFIQTYLDDETQVFVKEWENILKAINHRPFHPESSSHQKFLRKTMERLEKLKNKVDVSHELECVKSGLIKP